MRNRERPLVLIKGKFGGRVSLFREEVLVSRKDRLNGDVVLSQPVSTRVFVAVLCAIIVSAAVWLTQGTYARIETVPGILVTDIPSAKVVAIQNGTVTKLAVSEGQSVEKGEPLFVVSSDRRTVEGEVATRSLDSLGMRKQLSRTQVTLAKSRADAERSRLMAIISSADQQAVNLREQLVLQEEVVASNQQIFDQISTVVDRGFVSKVEFERRRQALLGAQQALASLRQRLSASAGEARQARSQLATVSIEAAQGISQIQEGMQAISAEEARLQGEQGYIVTAPISGRVSALATGEGRPATPGQSLMIIVPENSRLSAELYAPTRAVGFVEPGKEARLLYDAFPYQRFGSFQGKVNSISRIAIDPRDTDIPFPIEEPVYRVKVNLDEQSIQAFGDVVSLQPGMTLKANIVLERQSFLDWLLQPLNAVLNRNS